MGWHPYRPTVRWRSSAFPEAIALPKIAVPADWPRFSYLARSWGHITISAGVILEPMPQRWLGVRIIAASAMVNSTPSQRTRRLLIQFRGNGKGTGKTLHGDRDVSSSAIIYHDHSGL